MNDAALAGPSPARRAIVGLQGYLPRGNTLSAKEWGRRHRLLEWVLLLHVPALVGLGVTLGHPPAAVAVAVTPPVICLVVGHLVTHRRWASFLVTGGLVFCSIALVLLSRGSIEGHFHFFIIIGFIALYQDWVPFLWNVVFTTLSHGIGTIWLGGQIFNHPAAQEHPWIWSIIHGVAVLFACVGMVIFWRITEHEQSEKEAIGRRLITADTEINRRQFTSDLLVNLARRNQSMLHRQLDIINQLEDSERDPDALADLFRLDHLATRIRRNAESLLVLAGEQSPRTWSEPVLLRDVVRAAIAETEDLDRVVFAVDDRVSVAGAPVADLTHLLAELTENAVRYSPPETAVTIRARPNRRDEGSQLLTVEDWGVGMPADELAAANDLLTHPRDVDLAVSKRLGFHVVSRIAARHGITVSLTATPGSGITALVVLPAALFTATPATGAVPASPPVADRRRPSASAPHRTDRPVPGRGALAVESPTTPTGTVPVVRSAPANGATPASRTPEPAVPDGRWRGWWDPEVHDPAASGSPTTDGHAANGHGANGHGANGHGTNGHGTNGHGTNGHGANGHATNGHGANGHGTNGHGTNGHGTNGHGANGHAADGHTADGHATGSLATEGPGVDGHTPDRHDTDRHVTDDHGVDSRGAGADDHLATDDHGDTSDGHPVGGQGGARPARDVGAGGSTSGAADSSTRVRTDVRPVAGGAAAAPPAARPVPGPRPDPLRSGPSAARRPIPTPRPRAELPAASAVPAAPNVAEASGARSAPSLGARPLRRRVPQAHLAPELRQQGGPEQVPGDPVVPVSADAAATALSRYQASRQAAQAVVDVRAVDVRAGDVRGVPDGVRPAGGGEQG